MGEWIHPKKNTPKFDAILDCWHCQAKKMGIQQRPTPLQPNKTAAPLVSYSVSPPPGIKKASFFSLQKEALFRLHPKSCHTIILEQQTVRRLQKWKALVASNGCSKYISGMIHASGMPREKVVHSCCINPMFVGRCLSKKTLWVHTPGPNKVVQIPAIPCTYLETTHVC